MRLSDFSALTFDCYGTLIDWETGIGAALAPWLERAGVRLERDQVLEAFAELESAQQAATPSLRYPELLAEVHRGLALRLGIAPDAKAAAAFGASVGNWPAFADSAKALAYLKQHYRLVILSNVDRASFARSNARLGVAFDAICTAEDIGSYKPDPRNFDYLLRHLAELGIAKAQVLHTAQSLYHDHVPARAIGLATCWIHRRAAKQGHGATQRAGQRGQARFPLREPGCDGGRASRRARRLALGSAALELAADLDDGPVQLVLDRRIADPRAAGDRLEAGAVLLAQVEQQLPVDVLGLLRQGLAHHDRPLGDQARAPENPQVAHVELALLHHAAQVAARVAFVVVADAGRPGHAGVELAVEHRLHGGGMAAAEAEAAEVAQGVTVAAELVVRHQEAGGRNRGR